MNSLPTSARSITITGLTPSQVYSFRVVARNGSNVQTVISSHLSDDSTPFRVYTSTLVDDKSKALSLFVQAENDHRSQPYYNVGEKDNLWGDSSIRSLFDREALWLSRITVTNEPKWTKGSDPGASYSPSRDLLTIRTAGSKPYDIVHELIHGLADKHGWYNSITSGIQNEALAYAAADHLLSRRTADVGQFLLGNNLTAASAQTYWNNFFKTLNSYTDIVVYGPYNRLVNPGDVNDAAAKLKEHFSAVELLPVYNQYLVSLGYKPSTLTNTFAGFFNNVVYQ